MYFPIVAGKKIFRKVSVGRTRRFEEITSLLWAFGGLPKNFESLIRRIPRYLRWEFSSRLEREFPARLPGIFIISQPLEERLSFLFLRCLILYQFSMEIYGKLENWNWTYVQRRIKGYCLFMLSLRDVTRR